MRGRKTHRTADVGCSDASHDQRGFAIKRRIPQPPRRVVPRLAGRNDVTAQHGAQVLYVRGLQSQLPSVEPDGRNVRSTGHGDCTTIRHDRSG